MKFAGILCLLTLCQSVLAYPVIRSARLSTRINFFGEKKAEAPAVKAEPPVVIPEDFTVAGGFLVTSAALIAALNAKPVGIPVGLIGLLLAFQTTRVRFVFDQVTVGYK